MQLGMLFLCALLLFSCISFADCMGQCADVCTAEYDPRCGTDGVTYSNPCHLNNATCHSGGFIWEAENGTCKSSSYNCFPDCRSSGFCLSCGSNKACCQKGDKENPVCKYAHVPCSAGYCCSAPDDHRLDFQMVTLLETCGVSEMDVLMMTFDDFMYQCMGLNFTQRASMFNFTPFIARTIGAMNVSVGVAALGKPFSVISYLSSRQIIAMLSSLRATMFFESFNSMSVAAGKTITDVNTYADQQLINVLVEFNSDLDQAAVLSSIQFWSRSALTTIGTPRSFAATVGMTLEEMFDTPFYEVLQQLAWKNMGYYGAHLKLSTLMRRCNISSSTTLLSLSKDCAGVSIVGNDLLYGISAPFTGRMLASIRYSDSVLPFSNQNLDLFSVVYAMQKIIAFADSHSDSPLILIGRNAGFSVQEVVDMNMVEFYFRVFNLSDSMFQALFQLSDSHLADIQAAIVSGVPAVWDGIDNVRQVYTVTPRVVIDTVQGKIELSETISLKYPIYVYALSSLTIGRLLIVYEKTEADLFAMNNYVAVCKAFFGTSREQFYAIYGSTLGNASLPILESITVQDSKTLFEFTAKGQRMFQSATLMEMFIFLITTVRSPQLRQVILESPYQLVFSNTSNATLADMEPRSISFATILDTYTEVPSLQFHAFLRKYLRSTALAQEFMDAVIGTSPLYNFTVLPGFEEVIKQPVHYILEQRQKGFPVITYVSWEKDKPYAVLQGTRREFSCMGLIQDQDLKGNLTTELTFGILTYVGAETTRALDNTTTMVWINQTNIFNRVSTNAIMRCKIKNDVGEAEESVELIVFSPLQVDFPPSRLTEGTNNTIRCSLFSTPTGSLHFSINYRKIEVNETVTDLFIHGDRYHVYSILDSGINEDYGIRINRTILMDIENPTHDLVDNIRCHYKVVTGLLSHEGDDHNMALSVVDNCNPARLSPCAVSNLCKNSSTCLRWKEATCRPQLCPSCSEKFFLGDSDMNCDCYGLQPYDCSSLCENATCPGHDASQLTCVVDSCGKCRAGFYHKDTQRLDMLRFTVCNPCSTRTCGTNAECVETYYDTKCICKPGYISVNDACEPAQRIMKVSGLHLKRWNDNLHPQANRIFNSAADEIEPMLLSFLQHKDPGIVRVRFARFQSNEVTFGIFYKDKFSSTTAADVQGWISKGLADGDFAAMHPDLSPSQIVSEDNVDLCTLGAHTCGQNAICSPSGLVGFSCTCAEDYEMDNDGVCVKDDDDDDDLVKILVPVLVIAVVGIILLVLIVIYHRKKSRKGSISDTPSGKKNKTFAP